MSVFRRCRFTSFQPTIHVGTSAGNLSAQPIIGTVILHLSFIPTLQIDIDFSDWPSSVPYAAIEEPVYLNFQKAALSHDLYCRDSVLNICMIWRTWPTTALFSWLFQRWPILPSPVGKEQSYRVKSNELKRQTGFQPCIAGMPMLTAHHYRTCMPNVRPYHGGWRKRK